MIENFEAGELLKAQPAARPNPKLLVRQTLPNRARRDRGLGARLINPKREAGQGPFRAAKGVVKAGRLGGIRRGAIKRYIETPCMIVAVDVPVIYAPEEPEEPLLEAKTLKFLDEATRRADAGDRKWLARVGRVFERIVA